MGLHIDRCFCYSTTFGELKAVADATGAATVPELQQHVTFGKNCKLCHPYTRRMLRTGETVFHEIVTARDEPETVTAGNGGGRSS